LPREWIEDKYIGDRAMDDSIKTDNLPKGDGEGEEVGIDVA
jgi:hypothetical protein